MSELEIDVAELPAAVGVSAEAVLAAAGATACGDVKLLARAGALLCLRDRFARLGSIAASCRTAEIASRLRREALILASFAQARARGVLEPAASAREAFERLDGFLGQVEVIDRQVGLSRRARWTALVSDVTDDWPQPKTLGDVITAALNQLSEGTWAASSVAEYDRVCAEHAAFVRDAIWAASAASRLDELTRLDVGLEALRAALTSPRIDGSARSQALAELYATVAALRAFNASARAGEALQPLLVEVRG